MTDTPEQRRVIVDRTLATQRAEGIEPDEHAKADLEAFAAGDISAAELTARARADVARMLAADPKTGADPGEPGQT
jgi:hypothetical protein